MDIFDIRLTDDEMAAIQKMDTGRTLFLDHLNPEIVKTLSEVVANPIEVGDKRPSHDEWDKRRKMMDQQGK